jgi:hypothetical protein
MKCTICDVVARRALQGLIDDDEFARVHNAVKTPAITGLAAPSHARSEPEVIPSSPPRGLFWIAAALGTSLCAIWLWCCWCTFPASVWNDLRVAPAVALHRGFAVYSTTGVANTWIYGPLPLIMLWPAGWASSAAGALQVAGALNLGITALAIACTCFAWPGPRLPAQRLIALLLCLALWPAVNLQVFYTDNVAVALGLLSNLFLVRRWRWTAAALAVAAVASKQISLEIGAAQLIWLTLTVSWREAGRHLGRATTVAVALGALFISLFGACNLWHVMVELPGSFPWTSLADCLHYFGSYLSWYIGAPAVILLVGRRFFWDRRSTLLLPSLSYICALPIGLTVLLKVGGDLNSLHGLLLWLPPVLTACLVGPQFNRLLSTWTPLAGAIAAVALGSLRLHLAPNLTVTPDVQAYREAAYLAGRAPGGCWFPMNPLVTLYSDGKYYHDEDGLYERKTAGKPLTEARLNAHLPSEPHATIFPVGWTTWGLAARLVSESPSISGRPFGRWVVTGTSLNGKLP